MAKFVVGGMRKTKSLAEIIKHKITHDEEMKNQKPKRRAKHNDKGKLCIHRTKPKKQLSWQLQTERTKLCKSHSKEKTITSEEITGQENINTPTKTTSQGVLAKQFLSQSRKLSPRNGLQVTSLINKYPKKEISKRKSTLSMRKHHHATFSHLIHDAFIRLKCNPHYNHSGFTKRAITKNIEKHYRVKLGKKFKIRFELSFQKLVEKRKLIAHGKKRTGIRYTPNPSFLKQFERLKVLNGAANFPHGVGIHHSSKIKSRQSRSRSRSGNRSSRRSHSPSYQKGKRRVISQQSRPYDVHGSQQWHNVHFPHVLETGYYNSHKNTRDIGTMVEHNDNRNIHQKEEAIQASSSTESCDVGLGPRGLARWLWPNNKSLDGETGGTSTISEAKPDAILERKDEGRSNPRGFERFKPIEVSYPSSESESFEHPTSQETSPRLKRRWREVDTVTMSSQDSSEPNYSTTQSCWQSSDDSKDVNNYYDAIDSFGIDTRDHTDSFYMRNEEPSDATRQRKEHDLLHSLRSSSKQPNISQKSWLEKIGDTIRRPFGSETAASQASLCRSQTPSKFGPESSTCRVKKVMSKRHDLLLTNVGTIDGEESPSPRDNCFCSPKLASLLQE